MEPKTASVHSTGWTCGPWPARLAGAAILLATCLVYANSFAGVFLLDDLSSIHTNPTLGSLWTALSPPPSATVTGRPALNLTLAANFLANGLDPWGYHLVNLVIHCLAALTLFGLVRRTLLLPVMQDRFRTSALWIALATAMLWAVHPLQTESVTYIVQRAESLAGLFFLLVFYCLSRTQGRFRLAWSIMAAVACAAGMATKEILAVAPMLAIIYDRIFLAGSFAAALKQRAVAYAGMLAGYALLAVLVLSAEGRNDTAGFAIGINPWLYACSQADAIATYLRLVFWPTGQCLDYGNMLVASVAQVWPQATLVLALVLATIWALIRRPMLGFAGLWFFAILAPTSSFIPVLQTQAEHRMYLSSAGIILLCVLAARWAAGKLALSEPRRLVAGALCLALPVAGLGWITHQRNNAYRSELVMWMDAVASHPGYRVRVNYARALMGQSQYQQAIDQIDRCLGDACLEPYAFIVRGTSCGQLGRYEDAVESYTQVLRMTQSPPPVSAGDPRLPLLRFAALNNRADAYRHLRQFAPALADVRLALAVPLRNPGESLVARLTLVEIYADSGDLPGARQAARELEAHGGRLPPELAKALDTAQVPPR